MLKLAILSDVHNCLNTLRKRGALPDADVYVFSGDITQYGKPHELRDWRQQVQRLLNAGKKVVAIPGNHELGVEDNPMESLEIINPDPDNGFYWLLDSGCEIDGIKFWGTPWTPFFGGWAYNVEADTRKQAETQTHGLVPPEKSLEEYWGEIPEGIDVLITHGPPYGILDRTYRGQKVGSPSLRKRVLELGPQVHCFGHIHESYGQETHRSTLFVNASVCTLDYAPINPVPVVEVISRGS